MVTLERTAEFDRWLSGLRDREGRTRVETRLYLANQGYFGDCRPVGEGVSEMRIQSGPGYRLYFMRRGATVYLLLAGGDKSSQQRDILRAKELARRFR